MTHVEIEKTGFQLIVFVNGDPVLETGLDLTGAVVVDLPELIELLEEASDNLVIYTDNE
ncbi:hypothetical protein LCGC14_3056170 [marine sediment metagenome]|uniref:Uncharacterized protein n=1 Tax=marine sediment metagenome TaxID=412755 RepID=A0A0F8X8I1_9ZZZZ